MKESFSTQKEGQSTFDKTEENLPTPNLVFQEIIHLITDPYSSIYEIVSLISEDPALSFKTLRLVNRSESQKGETRSSDRIEREYSHGKKNTKKMASWNCRLRF